MYKEKAASKSKTEVITCRSRGYWCLPTAVRYHNVSWYHGTVGTTVPTVPWYQQVSWTSLYMNIP